MFFKRNFEKLIFNIYIYVQKIVMKQGPKRIILIRHGESIANIDTMVYTHTPDNKIPLSPLGEKQADEAGLRLKKLVGDQSIVFYVSPFLRTKQTYEHISKHFDKNKHIMIEDPRIREQERGNFQKKESDKIYEERTEIGHFFYRFENGGESLADVFDRCSSFLETLLRLETIGKSKMENKVLICHGGFMRLFIMRYFKFSVAKFEAMENPLNCEIWILERNERGSYTLTTDIKYTRH